MTYGEKMSQPKGLFSRKNDLGEIFCHTLRVYFQNKNDLGEKNVTPLGPIF